MTFDELPPVEKLETIEAPDYMQHFVNSTKNIESQRDKAMKIKKHASKTFPIKPQRDVLLYLMNYIPLEPWKHNILSMIRDESLYFHPQMCTKVMNEGWASYWDSFMMATRGYADDDGIFSYAKHHAGVLGGKHNMGNPYKLGVSLFNDIKDRWDKGKHGREWENCEDIDKIRAWDDKSMRGKEKIFDVREFYNDYTFINEYFTPEFCEKHEFFDYKYDPEKNEYVIDSRDPQEIKNKLLKRHENGGRPIIMLENLKYKSGSEILLRHQFDGQPLDKSYVKSTMKMLYKIVNRPISVKTIDVDVIRSTKYNASSSNLWYGTQYYNKTETSYVKTPIIYRYDGSRFTNVKDERTAREAVNEEGWI